MDIRRMGVIVTSATIAVSCGQTTHSVPRTSAPSTTTTLAPFIAQYPPPPGNPEGDRCQDFANNTVAQLAARGLVESVVTCVPVGDPRLAGYGGGATIRHQSSVAYPATYRSTEAFYRGVTAHELGHAWAFYTGVYTDPAKVARYAAIRNSDNQPWPNGDWRIDYADVFALTQGFPTPTTHFIAPVTPELIAQLRGEHLIP